MAHTNGHPIDSAGRAQREGSELLLWEENGNGFVVGFWGKIRALPFPEWGWVDSRFLDPIEPTWWWPLPDHPPSQRPSDLVGRGADD